MRVAFVPSPTASGSAVAPVAGQGSHQLVATAAAEGLAVLPDGDGVGAGERSTVLRRCARCAGPPWHRGPEPW